MRSLFFQNLNESGRHLFHFRGRIGRTWERRERFGYEIASGPAFRLMLTNGDEDRELSLSLGLLFFTVWLRLPGWSLPLLARGRQYGFYIHEWEVWAFFGSKIWESSSRDPWYYQIVIRPIDLLFGRTIYFKDEILSSWGPRRFAFRGREFQMDDIKISRQFWFKTRIPFGLYRRELIQMEVKIDKPPMRAGKGENSWDCGDDGSFGLSCRYDGPTPSLANREQVMEWCARKYCENVAKDIKRYGRASDDTAHREAIGFKYLGRVERAKADTNEAEAIT